MEPDATSTIAVPMRVGDEQGGMAHTNGRYIAWNSAAGEVRIKAMYDPSAPTLTLRETGGNTPIYPRVAVAPGGGAVAWLEILSGNNTEVHVRSFSEGESTIEPSSSERIIVTDAPAIGAYRISITHVQDSTYFVTWTEGPTTNLQVKWRLVDLSV